MSDASPAVINNILQKYIPDIEQAIKAALVGTPSFIDGVIRYHLGWVDQNFEPAHAEGGKMLRPVVCLLAFEALTGHYQPALPLATAIELIHNFSLLHDDIEDNDRERRGRATAWTIWGQPLAINVGDYLYTLAYHSLHQLDPSRFSAETILAVQRLMTGACLTLTSGQDLDLRFEQTLDVTADMYIDMVYKKTGALLEAAIVAGATLGTTDRTVIEHYGAFARNIGIAFQVRDDILGIWGDAAKTGKSVDNDLRRKKKTLPVIYTLNTVSGLRRDRLKRLYASSEPLLDDQIEFVRECLREAEALTYVQARANRYIDDAFAALHQIEIESQAQSHLEMIARFLVDRAH